MSDCEEICETCLMGAEDTRRFSVLVWSSTCPACGKMWDTFKWHPMPALTAWVESINEETT